MKINYFDLGVFAAKEISWMTEKILPKLGIEDYSVHGFEACKTYCDHALHRFEDNDRINLYNYAVSDHNGEEKLYYAENRVGNSIFKTKNNVTNKYEVVKAIKLSDFIKENMPTFDQDFNIMKINIEGAEWPVFKDLCESGLYKHFNIFCGQGHDVEKVEELSGIVDDYYSLLKKYNITLHRFTEWKPHLNADMAQLIMEKHPEVEQRDLGKTLKVLFLCDAYHWRQKMSRIRFHSIDAISILTDLKCSGLNWNDYDNNLTVQENIDILYKGQSPPDVVIAYEPLRLKKYSEISSIKCIRFAEMYDVPYVMKEIKESKSNLVLCFHKNEMEKCKKLFWGHEEWPLKFVNISKCAEKTIFKDYKLAKTVDVLLVGSIWHQSKLGLHYPLRIRMMKLFEKINKKYKCAIFKHPGGKHLDSYTNKYAIDYAKAINSAKICISCSGLPKTRFAKYVEIPLCSTAIAADIPNEDQDFFRKFVIEIDMNMSDEEIIEKISYYLENDEERESLAKLGRELSLGYTQEKYAQRFVKEVEKLTIETK